VTYFEIGCKDGEATAQFYAELFDWETREREHSIAFDTGGEGIGGHVASLGHEPQTYTIFYVEVDDLDATLAQAVELGGSTIVGPAPIADGRFAWLADPEGNTVGLVEFAPG
jgi:predicted enzyme related to lactoylglutathione lyase